ncbi:uncharacterized protein [Nicotiana tomentosiformis]|uniref:uncharacterized protein n=1 Tax=Nicotiana tomentosiformis TaxID=4098 RepID=UPI00388CE0CE
MVEADTVAEKDNQKISSRPMEKCSEMLSIAAEGCVVGEYEGVSETNRSKGEGDSLLVEGRELVPVKNLAPDSITGELPEGPDPSTQEEHYAPTWDETPCSSKEPKLQKKEELESILRKRKKEKKKKRILVKYEKVVNKKIVPHALVVDVDDEVEEELGSLVPEKSGERVVEDSGDKVVEESAEKVSKKSAYKGNSVRKSVK